MSISYEVSRQQQYLEQYYRLREHYYRRDLNIPDFDGAGSQDDDDANIFLALRQGRVLAGARIAQSFHDLTFSENLTNLLLQKGFEPANYCVWERLVLSDQMREEERHLDNTAALMNISWALGYDFAFMVSSKRNARLYRRWHHQLSVPFETLNNVTCQPTGNFSDLEHVLSLSVLRPVPMPESFSPHDNQPSFSTV